MYKGQTSIRDGIEDFLCPFTDMYITQGSMSNYTHKGIMANDVRGKKRGVRYEYYAPATSKVLKIYPESGQIMFQTINKVRFANNRIDYATYMTAHDDEILVKKGEIIKQGERLGRMGSKGAATGVHCHIEVSQSKDTTWFKNKYGIYQFNNEYDLDDCYYVNDTNILYGMGGNWKRITNYKFVNLPPTVDTWRVYRINVEPIKKNAIGYLKPKKFNGLSYQIEGYKDNNTTVIITTRDYGRVKIYIKDTQATITNTKKY